MRTEEISVAGAIPAVPGARGALTADAPGAPAIVTTLVDGVLLMAGGPRPSQLAAAAGMSTLDLSVDGVNTLLEVWLKRLADLGDLWARDASIRVVYCARTIRPGAPRVASPVSLTIEQEEHEYRGPAGLARDVFEKLSGDATVLVIEAGRFAACHLNDLIDRHMATGADITVGMNPDSTPAGIFVLRRSTLDLASRRGFMDLKEQWLRAALAAHLDVRVFRMDHPGIVPLRTREDLWRTALGAPARRVILTGDSLRRPPGVISPDAIVSPAARVEESLIMAGARVAPDAIVVRSILCPGAVVERGRQVIDDIVGGTRSERR